MESFALWLHGTPLAGAIADSAYLFPLFESLHVLAITLMMGSIALVDLRLIGVVARDRPADVLLSEVLPYTVWSFVASAITGTLLFMAHSVEYLENGPFVAKLVLMGVAGVNILVFHAVTLRSVHRWDLGTLPLRARLAGASSLLLWIAVTACGRWIGFTSGI